MVSIAKEVKETPSQHFKNRVKACKPFPVGLREKILTLYPQYNTEKGKRQITNVMHGYGSDVELTRIIEAICSIK